MSERAAPRQVMGLSFPTEAERVVVALGRARDHAVAGAATAVAMAAREGDPADRRALRAAAEAYAAAVGSALTAAVEDRFADACGPQIAAARAFATAFAASAAAPDGPPEAEARALLADARDRVVPALFAVADAVLVAAAADQNHVLDTIQARNERLLAMLVDMERIGRHVRIVALNAAVEAARTGGTSGRAFGVIATEIRDLADRAGGVLAEARRSVAEEGAGGAGA